MIKELRSAISYAFEKKVWYLTVTTITVSGNVSQVTFGPSKKTLIVGLRDSFHYLANQSKDYAVHTIWHRVRPS